MVEHNYRWDDGPEWIWDQAIERQWAEFAHKQIKTVPSLLMFFAGAMNSKGPKTQRLIDIAGLMYQAEKALEDYLRDTPEA